MLQEFRCARSQRRIGGETAADECTRGGKLLWGLWGHDAQPLLE